jgi:hypothetical protein
VTKQSIEEKTRVAWFKVITKNPGLKYTYGDDGYEVFKQLDRDKTQQQAADIMGVRLITFHRWHKEQQEMAV